MRFRIPVFCLILVCTNLQAEKPGRWSIGPYFGAAYSMINTKGPATDFSVITLPAPFLGMDIFLQLKNRLWVETGWGFFQPSFLMQYKDETLTTSKVRMHCIPLRIKTSVLFGRRSEFFGGFGIVYDPISLVGNSSSKIVSGTYRFDLSHSTANGILLSPSVGMVFKNSKENRHEIEIQSFIGNGHSMHANAYYFGQPENFRSFSSQGRTWALRYRYCFAFKRKKQS